jgi:hypothetical protein
MTLTTLGRLTSRHENGLSYNVLDPFRPLVQRQVSDLVVGPHALVHIQYLAQRWTAFEDIGPSPCGRAAHAMASDGRRVFVLGGKLPRGAQVDEAKLIHVLDTSVYFLFIISFGQPSSLEQCSLFTRNPLMLLLGKK